jgi:hypothetical protein
MEILLRTALLAWLAGDATLAAAINGFVEEAPARASLPFLAIAASASGDWSTKTETGREVRISLQLTARGDAPDTAADLVAAIEARLATLPRAQSAFRIVSQVFLRARVQQTAPERRSALLEYRFRLIAA